MNRAGVVEIPLHNGMVAIIDEADLPLLSERRWHAYTSPRSHTWYAGTYVRRRTLPMHRLLLSAAPGQIVDHKNRNGLDNRRSNLRFASHTLNQANRPLQRNNASGFRGVFLDKGRWRASVQAHRKTFPLGSFSSPDDAARAYDRAALVLFGEFAFLNFPGEVPAAPPTSFFSSCDVRLPACVAAPFVEGGLQ